MPAHSDIIKPYHSQNQPVIRAMHIFSGIITKSPIMYQMFQHIETIAPTPWTVLITGETGVGKELVAKSIHKSSCRKGSFVALSTAGVDDYFFSDTIFGHIRGAYTGSSQSREGAVKKAQNGTLFLDEIGKLNLSSQIKLLRLLQEGEFSPLGSDSTEQSKIRVLAATNLDLIDLIDKGHFLQDLFYRISIHNIKVPPLRERKFDIPILIDHFAKKAANELGKNKPTIPDELLKILSHYHFPGNVRELEAMVFDAVTFSNEFGDLSLDRFKYHISQRERLCLNSRIQDNTQTLISNPNKQLDCYANEWDFYNHNDGSTIKNEHLMYVKRDKLLTDLLSITVKTKGGKIKNWHDQIKVTSLDAIYEFLIHFGSMLFSRQTFSKYLNYRPTSVSVSYKTAGKYLSILYENGILEKNREKANKKRFWLSPSYLNI